MRRVMQIVLMVGLLWAQLFPSGTALASDKVRYAKTEVDKAAGKCVGSVLGGALLGGLMGGAIGGKNGTGKGVALGVAAGAGVCAILLANARHRDRIIQAQVACADQLGQPYSATFQNDNGQSIAFQCKAKPVQTIDAARLVPVAYKGADGGQNQSPVLNTGGHECRPIASALGSSPLPEQLVCRTESGDWRPYAESRT